MAKTLDIISSHIQEEAGYEGAIDPDVDLLEARILDSFSIVEVASFIQSHFEVELEAEDLTRDNFSTLNSMANLVDLRSPSHE